MVTSQGLDHILNTEFGSGTQVFRWFVGLIHGGGTPVLRAADTAALHPGWVESIIEGTLGAHAGRLAWVVTAGPQQVGNVAPIVTTNGVGDTPIFGFFLTSVRSFLASSGTLFCTLELHGGARVVKLNETLSIQLTISGTGS